MKNLILIAVLIPATLLSGEVTSKANALARKDWAQGWEKHVASMQVKFEQAERDRQDLTRWSWLNDNLSQAHRNFKAEKTIGNLKAITWWLALYYEWNENIPENWAKELEPYAENLDVETSDWAELLKKVTEKMP